MDRERERLLRVRIYTVKIGREGSEEVGFELSFERFKSRTNSDLSWKSIPAAGGIVGECSSTKSGKGSERASGESHVKRTSNR